MKAKDLLNEDYPGLGLSIISDINRIGNLYQEIESIKSSDEERPSRKISSLITNWVNKYYFSGPNMDLDGNADKMLYMIKTAISYGYKADIDKVKHNAFPNKGDSKKDILRKMTEFYTKYLPDILGYLPEFDEENVKDIKGTISRLKAKASNHIIDSKPQLAQGWDKDEDDNPIDTHGNQSLSQQKDVAWQTIRDIFAEIREKHGSQVVKAIRNKVKQSGQPMLALKLELDRRGIKLDESIFK